MSILVPNFKVELVSTISLTEIDGKLVLFSKDTGDFFGLNESALFLLKNLLDTDFWQAVAAGAAEYAVTEQAICDDLMELVTELEKQKLLRKLPLK